VALFGGKKREAAPMPPMMPGAGIPTERVIQMRQQGIPDNQIIDSLQKEGYNSTQIYDAISQAEIKATIEAPPGTEVEVSFQGGPAGAQQQMPYPEPMPQYQEPMQQRGMPPPPEPIPSPASYNPSGSKREEFEEIAESIIDEKWEELIKDLDKIISWKEETDARILKIEQQVNELKDRFDELHKGILAKIGDYDKNIRNVGANLQSMESVFKKILPTFTENVNELSRITSRAKESKKLK
jgi:uncharacterized protein (DUF433 family)